jgi:hypothetical protein
MGSEKRRGKIHSFDLIKPMKMHDIKNRGTSNTLSTCQAQGRYYLNSCIHTKVNLAELGMKKQCDVPEMCAVCLSVPQMSIIA